MKTRTDLLRLQRKTMVDWVDMYVDAITDDELRMEIVSGRNNGVWILGHLIASDDDLSLYINKQPMLFPELQPLFKQGSTVQNPDQYPPVPELRQKWIAVCEKNEDLFNGLSDDMLDEYHEMIKGDPSEDYFKTKEVVIINWT